MFKVMIVDDSLFQRKNLGKVITHLGAEVVAEAANGKEAVELYPVHRPHLVLLDLVMPEMEGVEAARRILDMDRDAKIIVVSSIGYEEMLDRMLSMGVKRFVTKPVDLNSAAGIIRSVMEGI